METAYRDRLDEQAAHFGIRHRVPGQSRSFNFYAYLACHAIFTDRSEAIFRVLR